MALFAIQLSWAFFFGLLGNVISLMVYLAPAPTFYRVYKKKSTEGFQSVPYVVALFSAMLWIYYAFLKADAYLLITINLVGCVIELTYITMYITYAPRKAKIQTAKFLLLLNFGVFSAILLFTLLLAKGTNRVRVLGWVCVAFATSVFAAPLSIMRLVIRTKSVEFMPFYLSLFLTLSAIVWFSYGFLLKDMYIALPNILGFVFGVAQMLLYVIYKDKKKVAVVIEDAEKVAPTVGEDAVKIKMIEVPGGGGLLHHVIDAQQLVISTSTTTTTTNTHDQRQVGDQEEKVLDVGDDGDERLTYTHQMINNEKATMGVPIDHHLVECTA